MVNFIFRLRTPTPEPKMEPKDEEEDEEEKEEPKENGKDSESNGDKEEEEEENGPPEPKKPKPDLVYKMPMFELLEREDEGLRVPEPIGQTQVQDFTIAKVLIED